MATAKKLPSGTWHARAYYKNPETGKVIRPCFLAATKTEALDLARDWERSNKKRFALSDRTVGDCIDEYISIKENVLSPSTIRGYVRMRRNNFSMIENIQLSKISDIDIQNFISSISRTLSPKSVRNVKGLLFPALAMFNIDHIKVTMPQKKPFEYDIPTNDQVKQMIETAYPNLKLAIVLASIGTMREGEISALFYRDVDYEKGGVHVRADMVKDKSGEWILKNIPKNDSSIRFIPLPAEVMELIGTGDPDLHICPITPAAIGNAFLRLKKKLGINCRFHDLRHYSISMMHALGIPDQYIQERSGHKTDACLKRVYRHSLSDQSVKFAGIANDHFKTLL